MKYLIILSILLLPFDAISQQENCFCSSDDEYQASLLNGIIGTEYSNPVAGYEGVQFLRDWAYGEILLNNGEKIKNAVIRYDRFADQLLWLRTRDYRKGVLNKSQIVSFTIYQEGVHPEEYYVKKRIRLPYLDSTEVFVHELVQGKMELFAYRIVKSDPVQSRLFDDTRLVISTSKHDYLLRLRRRNLLELPVINAEEMKKILRHNHIQVRNNEQGVAMALRFYNQLEL